MNLLQEIRKRARHATPGVIAASVVAYFLFHALQGDRGLVSWLRLRGDVETMQAQVETLAAERARLEHRVNLLHPDHLDPDMLEERAKDQVGLVRKDERIIPKP